jgi:hypothetical protein
MNSLLCLASYLIIYTVRFFILPYTALRAIAIAPQLHRVFICWLVVWRTPLNCNSYVQRGGKKYHLLWTWAHNIIILRECRCWQLAISLGSGASNKHPICCFGVHTFPVRILTRFLWGEKPIKRRKRKGCQSHLMGFPY